MRHFKTQVYGPVNPDTNQFTWIIILAVLCMPANKCMYGKVCSYIHMRRAETVLKRFSYENVFCKYPKDLQENTHAKVWFQ